MNRLLLATLLIGASTCAAMGQPAASPATGPATRPRTRFPRPDVRYEYGPDSQRHEDVPKEFKKWVTSEV